MTALDRIGGDRVAVAGAQPLHHALAQVGPLVLALGQVARDELAAELDVDVAALGDLERRGDRLGPLVEGLDHLLAGAQEELVGVEGHLRRRKRGLRLHAQQRRVVVVVLAAQVVHVAGAHDRAPDLAGDAHDPLVGLLLVGDAVLLDLEVDVVGAEGVHQVVDVGARLVVATVDQALAEARGQAAGEGDDALPARGELGHVQVRLAAVQALEEAVRGELDQVAVADVRGRQQREVVALDASRRAVRVVVDQVDLAAEDRLYVVLAARLVELDGAVHHPVVGEPQRRLAELRRALGEVLDVARAVEQRVLGVDVEVGAGRGAHGVIENRRPFGWPARPVSAPCGLQSTATPNCSASPARPASVSLTARVRGSRATHSSSNIRAASAAPRAPERWWACSLQSTQ
jgi:hypothetical protein